MTQQSPPSSTLSLRNITVIGVISITLLFVAIIIGVIIVNAQQPATTATNPAEQIQLGEQLFTQGTEGAAACALCHSLNGTTLVGPSLQHIATTAASRVQGQSAQDYIHTSIVNPTAYLVPGFESGSMAANYPNTLSNEETEALIAFLMTQE